jgi:hypothetical protein
MQKLKSMKKLSSIFFLFIFSVLFTTNVSGQTQERAFKSVMEYMKGKYKNYKPSSFGELSIQNYPREIEHAMNTKDTVKYSLIHTYFIGKKEEKEYFHLDKNLNVLGRLNFDEMMAITWKVLMNDKAFSNVIDSLGIDTNKIKFKEEKQ